MESTYREWCKLFSTLEAATAIVDHLLAFARAPADDEYYGGDPAPGAPEVDAAAADAATDKGTPLSRPLSILI